MGNVDCLNHPTSLNLPTCPNHLRPPPASLTPPAPITPRGWYQAHPLAPNTPTSSPQPSGAVAPAPHTPACANMTSSARSHWGGCCAAGSTTPARAGAAAGGRVAGLMAGAGASRGVGRPVGLQSGARQGLQGSRSTGGAAVPCSGPDAPPTGAPGSC